MKSRYVLAAWVASLVACGGGGGSAPATPTTTVMVFMAADNNLEDAALADLNEMEMVGSSADVNLVVEVDTLGVNLGGSATTKRLHVQKDGDASTVTSPVLQDLGETNTASGAAIKSFVTWALQNYPADRYVLILWDHGGGWPGYSADETSGAPAIPTEDLAQALEEIRTATGISRFDMLGFDACLMATVEVAHEMAPHARYLVASEEIEPGQGWPYAEFLGPLVANPRLSIRDFATSIPALYQAATTSTGDGDTTTLSTVDLAQVPALVAALDAFADQLVASGVDAEFDRLGRARYRTDKYNSQKLSATRDALDLDDLAAKIIATPGVPAAVTAAASDVRAAIAAAVLASDKGQVHIEAGGLSIYFPPGPVDPNYAGLSLAVDTSWNEYLAAYAAKAATDMTAPVVTVDATANLVDPTAVNPARLDVSLVDVDVLDLQGWVVQDQGGGIVDILGAVSQNEAAVGQTRIEWDGSLAALSDGSIVSALPIFPLEPGGCSVAAAFVRYRASAAAPDKDLLMLLSCATGQIIGFYEEIDLAGRSVIGAVEPRPGSEMAVLFLRYDLNSDSVNLVPGATLHLPAGKASLNVTSGPAGPGSYGLLAIVRDLAGNTGGDGATVTVQ